MQAVPMRKGNNVHHDYKRSLLIGALMGIGIAVIFSAGFVFRDLVNPMLVSASANPQPADSTEGYPLLDEVQALLDQHYLREQPDAKTRQYAAIRGVLSALQDRYTIFVEPPVAQSESDVLAGTYGGIGVLLRRSETGEFVLSPFPDSPAVKAGIEEGDILRAVNGTPIEVTQQQDALDQMLRGEVKEGSGVEITFYKPQQDQERTTFILFDVIKVPSVLWRVLTEDENLGYMQILNFTNRTPDEVVTALDELSAAGILGLILDLRNNRGGLLQESIEVADEFLNAGVVVYDRDAHTERTYNAEDGGRAVDIPLVVLVNQNTASAAELVAGAIQDYQRGILIGQTTYGKGTVQQLFRLSDSSSVHITSAEFLTPNRNTIDGKGLQPNISMIPDENARDVEIGEAIRFLQQTLGTSQ